MVDGTHISEKDNIKIYLDNVNINTSTGSALQIQSSVQAQVYIYLEGINNLNSEWKAALQKDNTAKLTIDNSPNTTGELIATGIFGAGIGGEQWKSSSDITIRGGSVTATSSFGAGIGGGQGNTGSDITISGGSVKLKLIARLTRIWIALVNTTKTAQKYISALFLMQTMNQYL